VGQNTICKLRHYKHLDTSDWLMFHSYENALMLLQPRTTIGEYGRHYCVLRYHKDNISQHFDTMMNVSEPEANIIC